MSNRNLWKDLFTTTPNTDVNARTPSAGIGTGVTAGNYQGVAGSAKTDAVPTYVTEGSGSGNRRYTQSLGVDDYKVELDITAWSATVNTWAGIIVRATTGAGANAYECDYDAGAYHINAPAGGGTTVTLIEAAPVGAVTFLAEASGSVIRFYKNGVLKLTLSGANTAGSFAGMIPGNFSAGAGVWRFTRFEIYAQVLAVLPAISTWTVLSPTLTRIPWTGYPLPGYSGSGHGLGTAGSRKSKDFARWIDEALEAPDKPRRKKTRREREVARELEAFLRTIPTPARGATAVPLSVVSVAKVVRCHATGGAVVDARLVETSAECPVVRASGGAVAVNESFPSASAVPIVPASGVHNPTDEDLSHIADMLYQHLMMV